MFDISDPSNPVGTKSSSANSYCSSVGAPSLLNMASNSSSVASGLASRSFFVSASKDCVA